MLTFFFAFKARSMPVSFRGQQRADDEGIRQGSTPIKYAVKRQCNRKILSVANALEAFGLDAPLTAAVLCPKTRKPTSAPSREQKVEAGKLIEGRSSELGMQVSGYKIGRSAMPRPNEKRDAEGAEATGAPSRRPLRVARR